VPAVANVKLKVPFGPTDPLSHNLLSLVTVCVIGSLFVHVIVVPAATVIVAGLNAIPCIKTSLAPGPLVPPVPPVPPVIPVILLYDDLLQLFRIISVATSIVIPDRNLFFELFKFFILIIVRITKQHRGSIVHLSCG